MSSMMSWCSAAAFSFNPSSWGLVEMVIIFGIILIFFGPKRLPQLSRSIGKAITDFKRGLRDVKDDIENAGEEDEQKPAPTAPAGAKQPENPSVPVSETKNTENH